MTTWKLGAREGTMGPKVTIPIPQMEIIKTANVRDFTTYIENDAFSLEG